MKEKDHLIKKLKNDMNAERSVNMKLHSQYKIQQKELKELKSKQADLFGFGDHNGCTLCEPYVIVSKPAVNINEKENQNASPNVRKRKHNKDAHSGRCKKRKVTPNNVLSPITTKMIHEDQAEMTKGYMERLPDLKDSQLSKLMHPDNKMYLYQGQWEQVIQEFEKRLPNLNVNKLSDEELMQLMQSKMTRKNLQLLQQEQIERRRDLVRSKYKSKKGGLNEFSSFDRKRYEILIGVADKPKDIRNQAIEEQIVIDWNTL